MHDIALIYSKINKSRVRRAVSLLNMAVLLTLSVILLAMAQDGPRGTALTAVQILLASMAAITYVYAGAEACRAHRARASAARVADLALRAGLQSMN